MSFRHAPAKNSTAYVAPKAKADGNAKAEAKANPVTGTAPGKQIAGSTESSTDIRGVKTLPCTKFKIIAGAITFESPKTKALKRASIETEQLRPQLAS